MTELPPNAQNLPPRTRRTFLRTLGAVAAGATLPRLAWAAGTASGRPPLAARKFTSPAVETFLTQTAARIPDPELAHLFIDCFPNTLDTTVEPGTFEGKPDTAVITGDIPAMWLRDSSAQVWPYLPLASRDPSLRRLLEGVIRRQTRCILIDPYANAFMADLSAPPLPWATQDETEMKPGVGERKYELDSLCWTIRLAHGYWRATGDSGPFDVHWHDAMKLTVATMRVQQRKHGNGPYSFKRTDDRNTETLPNGGFGNPVNPNGLIASGFRPSDDACIFPFFIPANLFAVTSLRQLATMAQQILGDATLANDATSLAAEVESALRQHAIVPTAQGTIWAYEIDGYGSQSLMDDANVPSLLALPYLEASPDPALYARTRAFCWSPRNPWFFSGTAGEGVGGPHMGADGIWPMSQMIYALTSTSPAEIRRAIAMLKASSAGTGFMHETYFKDDASRFTRPWFAWANSLFGELVAKLVLNNAGLLSSS